VLKQVGETRVACGLVLGAHRIPDLHVDYGRLVVFNHQGAKAVRKGDVVDLRVRKVEGGG
jgi:hypothetical protein